MQCLNFIHIILFLFGHKTQIQEFLFCEVYIFSSSLYSNVLLTQKTQHFKIAWWKLPCHLINKYFKKVSFTIFFNKHYFTLSIYPQKMSKQGLFGLIYAILLFLPVTLNYIQETCAIYKCSSLRKLNENGLFYQLSPSKFEWNF